MLAAGKATVAAGLLFNVVNDSTESTDDFLQKLMEVSKAKGPFEYIEPGTRESSLTPSVCGLPASNGG